MSFRPGKIYAGLEQYLPEVVGLKIRMLRQTGCHQQLPLTCFHNIKIFDIFNFQLFNVTEMIFVQCRRMIQTSSRRLALEVQVSEANHKRIGRVTLSLPLYRKFGLARRVLLHHVEERASPPVNQMRMMMTIDCLSASHRRTLMTIAVNGKCLI